MAIWSAPDMWQGGKCFILAGGPSMPRQFGIPEETIKKVMNRELPPAAYSPFLTPVHDSHVIAVNNGYQIGNWIDVLFFGDCAWHLYHRKKLALFPGLKVTCCKNFLNKPIEKSEGIKYLNKKHSLGISDDKSTVFWNNNSGSAAINMAVHFGVKQIVLLGFDMNLDSNGISHWHGSHCKPSEGKKASPFNRHLRGFPQIAEDAKQMGVEILNASPNSAILNFPKVDLKDLL